MGTIVTGLLTLHPTVQMLIIFALVYLIKDGYIVTKWTKAKKKGITNVHLACKNSVDFLRIKRNERYIGSKIFRIKHFDCISEQLAVIDITLDRVKDLLIDAFKIQLSIYNPQEEVKREAIKTYRVLLKGGITESTRFLRRCMQKNHLLDRSDLQYQGYMQDRSMVTYQKLFDFIEENYIRSVMVITFDELKANIVVDIAPKLTPLFSDMFIKVRLISEEKTNEIKKIEESN